VTSVSFYFTSIILKNQYEYYRFSLLFFYFAVASKVEIYISCRNLPRKDLLSKSDPLVNVYLKKDGKEQLIGKTEAIQDNDNPDFKTKIEIDYTFETLQELKFEVRDDDDRGNSDFVGLLRCSLGDVVASPGSTMNRILVLNDAKNTPTKGSIIIKAEELKSCSQHVTLTIHGNRLAKMDGFFW